MLVYHCQWVLELRAAAVVAGVGVVGGDVEVGVAGVAGVARRMLVLMAGRGGVLRRPLRQQSNLRRRRLTGAAAPSAGRRHFSEVTF